MANGTYLKLFVDSLEKYRKLNDAEFGRLMRAALAYKATGEEVSMMGREELLWDGMKLDIDRDNEKYETFVDKQRENGKKGGRPTKPKLTQANPKNPSLFSKTQKSQDKDKDKDKDKDYTPHTPTGGGEGFDEFWSCYPRKVGKKDAAKAWDKLPKNIELQSILGSLSAWTQSRQWTKDGGEFIPYPATFLNKELWKETPPTAATGYAGDYPIGRAGTAPLGDLEKQALARMMQGG